MSRVDQERVTVKLAGVDLGVFDGFTGGAPKAESTKHRPGGMGSQESLGGPVAREDFTISRLFKLERDLPRAKFVDGQVGSGPVVAVRQKLNADRSPAGDPITYTGTLTGYVLPDHDSDSSDKAMFQLEVSADEPIS